MKDITNFSAELTMTRAQDKEGWSLGSQGDNGIDLLTIFIKASGIEEASTICGDIVQLIKAHPYERNEDIQISVRDWQTEVIMATPTDQWKSKAQKNFAKAVHDYKLSTPKLNRF